MKRDAHKIVGVVAWDCHIARIADRSGVEILSVGDSVGVNLSWGFGFQRALNDTPEFKSDNASDQNFGESVVSSLSYGYDFDGLLIPNVGVSLTTGGSPYTPTGELRPWFFDYLTPSNNLTQIGLNLSWRL